MRVDREVHVTQRIAGLVQHLAERHWDELQIREDPIALFFSQSSENVVLQRAVWSGRHFVSRRGGHETALRH